MYGFVELTLRCQSLALFPVELKTEFQREFRQSLGIPDFFERVKVFNGSIEFKGLVGFPGQRE